MSYAKAKKKNSCVSGSPTDPVVLAPTVNFFFFFKSQKKKKKKKKKKCEVRLQRPIRFIIGDSVVLLFQHGGARLLAFERGGYSELIIFPIELHSNSTLFGA